MKTYKIYTAGEMGCLTFEQQTAWRLELEHLVRQKNSNVLFIHPPLYYRYDEHCHKSERETMTWCLSQIADSDIVIVNLNNIGNSMGTHIELGFIEAINQMSIKHIHLIGVGTPNVEHPWINEILLRREDSLEQTAEYIADYLLI